MKQQVFSKNETKYLLFWPLWAKKAKFKYYVLQNLQVFNFEFVSVGYCLGDIWRGNGYCDDANNNIACNFDDGDCCGSCVNREFCSDCLCLSEGSASTGNQIFVVNTFYDQPYEF